MEVFIDFGRVIFSLVLYLLFRFRVFGVFFILVLLFRWYLILEW